MPRIRRSGRVLDARPDRADLRDRPYRPPLVSLPEQHPSPDALAELLPAYRHAELVGDQRHEGSCTGWALRGVVGYLLFRRELERPGGTVPAKVSARMLYHLARIYDEWDGEDYEGSSCRGAMKGWHKHGVCREDLWPYEPGVFVPPSDGWEDDAATRPLGAYYRVERDSVLDLQAAVHEVGAVFASATIHTGWFDAPRGEDVVAPPVLRYPRKSLGGHAFAIVGYMPDGFLVQNSWGPGWGRHGFAVMTYEDWMDNGMDAWVAVLGAPMRGRPAPDVVSPRSLQSADPRAALLGPADPADTDVSYDDPRVRPLERRRALRHAVVLGNEGRPQRRLVAFETARSALRHQGFDRPLRWLRRNAADRPKVALYAHGGLNSEPTGVRRAQVLAPYFLVNGIYPLFLVWRSGLVETLASMLADVADRVLPWRSTGWLDDAVGWIAEKKDRSVELAARGVGTPVWGEMKENAARAADPGGATRLLADHLSDLADDLPGLEIHLAGHSAGGILLGHMLPRLGERGLAVRSLHLFAPACTTRFALDVLLPQMQPGGVLAKARLRIDGMDDERERADSVGPYGKSLLYLISRALEPRHKTPLLGLAEAWTTSSRKRDVFHEQGDADVAAWVDAWGGRGGTTFHSVRRVSTGHDRIPLAHGSFDNDVRVMSRTIRAMRGRKLAARIEDLGGF